MGAVILRMNIGDFDLRLLPRSFYENPYPTYAALRAASPVRASCWRERPITPWWPSAIRIRVAKPLSVTSQMVTTVWMSWPLVLLPSAELFLSRAKLHWS